METERSEFIETPRKTAGFEWAAEPDEMLFPCCATKWVMVGIAAFLCVISIIAWIVASIYTGFVWLVSNFFWVFDTKKFQTISTLFMLLIIFLPEYFSNIINFAVNFCVWVAFAIFSFVYAIKHLVDRGDKSYNEDSKNRLMAGAIFEFIEFIGSVCVCILMFRMLYFYYQNRGNDNVMAVAA
ncbi:hypothetical protein CAEBREN_11261 [Caenorhabditis brenneri]|uniref:MARVEL domain-containing protein n=1 Tax=Caenorhabditis brenneri TaxID=135651 RepID=G0MPF9_CAEBE|nr:hypothetical protein CAEBREN_11261 [Caenorhabditis brenneri]